MLACSAQFAFALLVHHLLFIVLRFFECSYRASFSLSSSSLHFVSLLHLFGLGSCFTALPTFMPGHPGAHFTHRSFGLCFGSFRFRVATGSVHASILLFRLTCNCPTRYFVFMPFVWFVLTFGRKHQPCTLLQVTLCVLLDFVIDTLPLLHLVRRT